MRRRDFIKMSGHFSLGALLLPGALGMACRKKDLLEGQSYDGKITIIGAGAAGLYAGYILKSRNINFEILEASNQVGGRLGKLEGFADYTLDTGAQWLHGRNNILGDLIRKTKTEISKDNSDAIYWFNQQLIDKLPRDVASIFEEKDGLPDISFDEYRIQEEYGDEYKYIVENLAGDQGADASRLSVFSNIKEEEAWSSGDDDYKFKDSFYDLFEKEIIPSVINHIRLNTVISEIDYSNSIISITDANGNKYKTDKTILTVPITVLQDEDIQFIPPLTASKKAAFQKIGMDAGMKVFLKFTTAFYNENIIGGEVAAAYANEKEGKQGSDHVLLAFIMGGQAERLTALGTDQAIVTELLQELDSMYSGQATSNFIKAHVENWTTHPFIRGAYSYSKVGIGNARSEAAKSVSNQLFFAGEAFNLNGHHQTVHGAAETGYQVLVELLEKK